MATVAQRLLALDDGRAVDVHSGRERALRGAARKRGATVRLLLARTGRHAPDPAVVRELGLEGARAEAVWAGAGLRGGRGVLVASRAARRAAAREERAPIKRSRGRGRSRARGRGRGGVKPRRR